MFSFVFFLFFIFLALFLLISSFCFVLFILVMFFLPWSGSWSFRTWRRTRIWFSSFAAFFLPISSTLRFFRWIRFTSRLRIRRITSLLFLVFFILLDSLFYFWTDFLLSPFSQFPSHLGSLVAWIIAEKLLEIDGRGFIFQ